MRVPFFGDLSAAVSPMRTLIAAASLLLVAACSTMPGVPAAPEGSDASEPAPNPPEVERREQPRAEPVAAPTAGSDPAPKAPAPAEPAAEPARDEIEPAEIAAAPTTPASPAPPVQAEPAPEPPATFVLSGRVKLDVSQVDEVDGDSVRDTVVYFQPAGQALAVEPGNFEITTRRKRLLPDVLVIPVGSTVAFPNRDDILHNVFSVSSAANFDLGLYGEGESKSHTFSEPGLAVVHCNVHHAMRADVLVVDTPFFTRVDSEGRFSIQGVPANSGELVVWHPRATFMRRQITLPAEAPLELELSLVRPRIPDHLDKSGQPYRPERPGRR